MEEKPNSIVLLILPHPSLYHGKVSLTFISGNSYFFCFFLCFTCEIHGYFPKNTVQYYDNMSEITNEKPLA